MTDRPALEAGVSLARYAHATAALADGFTQAEALDLAGIAKSDWPSARMAWLGRIGGSGPASKDFTDYQAAYADAEDAFGRGVRPIDSELAAWLSFLALCEKSPNLGELLDKLELRTSDLSRLSRGWKRRFEKDPKLEPQIAELRKKPLPELGKLTLGKSRGVSLPLGDDDAKVEPAPAVAAAPVASPPEAIPLDRYAAMRSDIDRGDALAAVLALFRIDEATYARADAFYRAAFAKDAALAADFRVLRAHADQSFRQRSQTSLAAPRAAPDATPIDLPPPSVPQPRAGLDPSAVSPAAIATPLPPAPMARRPAPATLDVAVPRGKETLPFKTPVPGATPSAPPSAPPPESGDIFAIAARMKARDAMTGTVEGGTATPRPLPFSTKKKPAAATAALAMPVAPAAATPFKSRPGEAPKRAPPQRPGVDPALAKRMIPPRRPGAAARALLTLEQHAAMHAELGVGFPLTEVLARYGLDGSHREEVDEHYRLSFSRDARVRTAWDQTYRAMTQWMTARR